MTAGSPVHDGDGQGFGLGMQPQLLGILLVLTLILAVSSPSLLWKEQSVLTSVVHS